MTTVQMGDQPRSLGYSAGRVCTQALCRGSSMKKTFIQENPAGHLLVPHTPFLLHTHCPQHTLEPCRLTAAATAETHGNRKENMRAQLLNISLTEGFYLISAVKPFGKFAVLQRVAYDR